MKDEDAGMDDALSPGAIKSIKRQVCYYLCDSNLVRDDFLQTKIGEDSDGFVDLAVLCTFNRMKTFLKLGEDVKVGDAPASVCKSVGEILRDCEDIVVSEDGLRVKRKEPLGDVGELKKMIKARSLHVTPFPFDTKLETLEDFFRTKVPINSVQMLKKRGAFSGDIFLECKSIQAAQELIDMEIEYAGALLRKEFKGNWENGRGDRQKKMKEGKMVEEKAKKGGNRPEPETIPGCLVRFEFLKDAPESVNQKGIRAALTEAGFHTKWVVYVAGSSTGTFQLESPEVVDNLLQQTRDKSSVEESDALATECASTMELCSQKAKLAKVEDAEEEKEFYSHRSEVLKRNSEYYSQKARGRGRGRGRGGRGGRGRGGRGKGGRDREAGGAAEMDVDGKEGGQRPAKRSASADGTEGAESKRHKVESESAQPEG